MAERGRLKQRLEASEARLWELQLLRQKQELLVLSALTGRGDLSVGQLEMSSVNGAPWGLMVAALEEQLDELSLRTMNTEPSSRAGDYWDISGSQSVHGGQHCHAMSPVRYMHSCGERPKSVAGDVFTAEWEALLGSGRPSKLPRSFSVPYPPLRSIEEEEGAWAWQSDVFTNYETEFQRDFHLDSYILALIQRRALPHRPDKTQVTTATGDDLHAWVCHGWEQDKYREEYLAAHQTQLNISSRHEVSNLQTSACEQQLQSPLYIPGQMCRSPHPATRLVSKQRVPRASRSQSESSVLTQQRSVTDMRSCRRKSRPNRPSVGKTENRGWSSSLELTQKGSGDPDAYTGSGGYRSSVSEMDSDTSSFSSDSDDWDGLVWPQQLAPPSNPAPPAQIKPTAFVKIKASHALKKKILRFHTGSLKIMTTM